MTMTKKELFHAIGMYLLAALFLFYEMGVQVSPSIMTRQLMRDFGIDSWSLGLMASFYFYSYTVMQIPAGLLFDRFGPRSLLSSAAVICALGTLFFSFTETVVLGAIGRFFMGIGSSFAFIGVLVVAARWFDGKYFAFLVGLAQFLAALGAISGEVPLAAAVEAYGWRDVMFWLMGAGLVLALLNFFVLRDRPEHEHYEVMEKENSLGTHLRQVVMRPQTWAVALYAFSGWGPMALFASLWGIPYLMEKFQISNSLAATTTMMMWLGLAFGSPFVGYLSDRMGRRLPIMWIGSLIGLISFILILYIPYLPLTLVFFLLFFAGLGCSAHILTFALVRDNNPTSIVASGIGFNNMAVVIGGAILQPLGGAILSALWDGAYVGGIPYHTTGDFTAALSMVVGLYGLGLIASLFLIRETRCSSTC